MVGRHVKHFQEEMTLAKIMEGYAKKRPAMPYGYPVAVYCPLHVCQSPQVKKFVARTPAMLSNGVPKVLGMELVDQYVLGLYNPPHACPAPKDPEPAPDPPRVRTRRPGFLTWVRSLQMSDLFATQQNA